MTEWVASTIGELRNRGHLTLQTGPFGSQLHSSDYVPYGIPVVPTEAIAHRRLRTDNLPNISPETARRLQRHRLRAGDILFARRGAQATGASALVKKDNEGWICGTGAILLRVTAEGIDPVFLSFFLSSNSAISWLKSQAVGAVMPNLNTDVISGLPILLPPLTEQRAIANLLEALDDKIELNRRMNETLETIARAIFKSWFVDFDPVRANAEGRQPANTSAEAASLFSRAFHQVDDSTVPLGWNIAPINEDFKVTMGQSPPGNTYNEIGDGIPFFQGRTDFGFRYPSARVYCTAPTRVANTGDTLVSVRAPVGDINMARQKCCLGRGVAGVRHRTGSRGYTFYSMRSLGSKFARFEAEGTVFGSINKQDFNNLRVVIPPSKLVIEFEKLVSPLDERIELNTAESDTLVTFRDVLLPKLLSGEVRVQYTSMGKGA